MGKQIKESDLKINKITDGEENFKYPFTMDELQFGYKRYEMQKAASVDWISTEEIKIFEPSLDPGNA